MIDATGCLRCAMVHQMPGSKENRESGIVCSSDLAVAAVIVVIMVQIVQERRVEGPGRRQFWIAVAICGE